MESYHMRLYAYDQPQHLDDPEANAESGNSHGCISHDSGTESKCGQTPSCSQKMAAFLPELVAAEPARLGQAEHLSYLYGRSARGPQSRQGDLETDAGIGS